MAYGDTYKVGLASLDGVDPKKINVTGALLLANATKGDTFEYAARRATIADVPGNGTIMLELPWPDSAFSNVEYLVIQDAPQRNPALAVARNLRDQYERLRIFDQAKPVLGIKAFRVDAPPLDYAVDDMLVIGFTPTGVFASRTNAIARWTEEGTWFITAPEYGWRIISESDSAGADTIRTWDGADWVISQGLPGVDAGLSYKWSTDTANTDPGAGYIKGNAALASITALRISKTDAKAFARAAFLATWDDATAAVRGIIQIQKKGGGADAIFNVTGALTDNGTWDSIVVAHVQSSGTFANGDDVIVSFSRSANNGATGPAVGATFVYSTTTTDADPGNGVFRFNGAVGSATKAFIDNLEAGGASVTTWLDAFDDPTATVKGMLYARGVTSQTAFAVFAVVGTVVDGTGYRKIDLIPIASGGTWTNGHTFALSFSPSGNNGANGAGNANVPVNFGAARRLLVSEDAVSDIEASGITVDASNNISGVGQISSGQINISGFGAFITNAAPRVQFIESDAAVDESHWRWVADGGQLRLGALNDANTTESIALRFIRSGATVTAVNFPINLQFNGNQVLSVTLGAALSGGAWTTSYSAGTVSSGTLTPAMTNRNVQHYTNNGAHTLAPPTTAGSIIIDCTNGASAGAVTRSGFTKVDGDVMATTNGKKYRHFITVGDAGSHCYTKEMA